MFVMAQRDSACDAYTLRHFNVFALLFTMLYASDCRALISSLRPGTAIKNLKAGLVSAETLHTAFNIALFPPLFFFSGLFYTDVLSTGVVLKMYGLFLQREGKGLVWLYITGMVALTMRQTNIFWGAVFMGGLEAVRSVKGNKSAAFETEPAPRTWQEHVVSTLKQWSRGEIHDISLKEAGVHGKSTILLLISRTHLPRFHPLRAQHRHRHHLQTRPSPHPPMALHRPPYLFRRFRILEWRRGLRR